MTARLYLKPDGKKILESIKKTDIKTVKGIRKAFYEIGRRLKETANNSILRGQKTGRTYIVKRGSVKRSHKSSARGEAWANISGRARRSIGYNVSGADSLRFTGGGNKADYVKFLEDVNGLNRAAMWQAINDQDRNIEKYLGSNVIKEVKKI